MKRLVVAGCSFSALYYHTNPMDSYSLRLAKSLGYSLVNLSLPGASVNTVSRLLHQYLDHNEADFVFVQLPNSNRSEYFVDSDSANDYTDKLNLDQSKWIKPGEYASNYYRSGRFGTGGTDPDCDWHLVDTVLERALTLDKPGEASTAYVNNSYLSIDIKAGNLRRAHEFPYSQDSHSLVNLHSQTALIEQLLESKHIPYAYVESNCEYEHGDVKRTHMVDTIIMNNDQLSRAHKYSSLLCSKKHFIPYEGINNGSKTWANDDYKCGHPGAKSHRRFCDRILPIIQDKINNNERI